MNETKEKIQAMIDEEIASNRRQDLNKERSKKSNLKEKIPVDDQKKQLIRSLFYLLLMLIASFILLYGASLAKDYSDESHKQSLTQQAKNELDIIARQSQLILKKKFAVVSRTLQSNHYIKNFNKPNWQDIFKVELTARLGPNVSINIIPANFKDDEIIDQPNMGYAMLSLLNELKNIHSSNFDSNVRAEVHRANEDNAQLILAKRVNYTDTKQKKNITLGFIIVHYPQSAINKLIATFSTDNGYLEITQSFSNLRTVLVKKGLQELQYLPLSVSKKIPYSPWMLKFWPIAQQDFAPILSLLPAIIALFLGILLFLVSITLAILKIKKYRISQEILLPQRQQNKSTSNSVATTHDSPNITKSKDITNSIYNTNNGIILDESNEDEAEYLHHVTDKIFRAYDIRGVVGEFVNPEVFRQIAYGIAKEMVEQQQSQISIGYDGRNSSEKLVKSLIDALLESGIDVMDIGMVSSPILYFSAITKTAGNGIIVTASHNPANYNGMKIMLSGHSYSQARLQALKQKVIKGERVTGEGTLSQANVLEEYITKITGNVILARPMNIVIDCANGVTGKFASTFFEQLGCNITIINEEVDGNFPNHAPDPSRPENLSELIEKVMETKSELGIAFDGDGDRIALVSSGGEIIWPDRILMLLAKDILSRNSDATILYDVKSTWKLDSFVRELGGKTQMCKSGHSFMKSKLLETGALLAGEMSGHIFIKERWFGFDDALFVAARILEVLSIDLRKSRQVFAELPDSLNTPEILIATDNAPEIIETLSADLSCFDEAKIIDIDGIRVEYSDGWGLVRSSNTTDNLTLRFEADDEEALQRIASTFKSALMAIEPKLKFPF